MGNPKFITGTTDQDAQALVMAALQTIAGGWPAVYFRQPKLEGGSAILDTDAMIADAVRLAVQVQAVAVMANRHETATVWEN